MAHFLVVGIVLILTCAWLGQVLGELHAAYRLRKERIDQ